MKKFNSSLLAEIIRLKHIKLFAATTILILFSIPGASAVEPIMITVSSSMDKINFDGKWTFYTEWKQSSLNTISYPDGTQIQLRTAHQGNFIYVLIDETSKTKFAKNGDMAIICFDKNNTKSITATENDYCFGVPFDGKYPFTLRGGSSLMETSHYMKMENPSGLIGISSVSDQNDRYTSTPHASYEFRIPTDMIGRSDIYGFYLGVYDQKSNHVYSWPQEVSINSPFGIPSPKNWGEIISPDKSLPEFSWPLFIMIFSFALIIFVTRRQVLLKDN
jgi:hypothetical protein